MRSCDKLESKQVYLLKFSKYTFTSCSTNPVVYDDQQHATHVVKNMRLFQ